MKIINGALLALALGVAAFAGCAPGTDSGGGIPSVAPESSAPSSSAGGTPSSKAPGTSAPPTPDAYAYAACMREHGIDMADPDPKTGLPTIGDSVDPESAAFKEAHAACGDLLPGGIRGQGDDTELDAYLEFAQCMRKNGMPDFPDPQPGSGEGMFPGIDRNDPAFGKASEACQHILAGSDQ